jgi:hypothetical protein
MLRLWPAAYSEHRKWVLEGALSALLYDEPRIDVWIISKSHVDAFDKNPERYVDIIPSIQALSLDRAQSYWQIIEFWNYHTRGGSRMCRQGEPYLESGNAVSSPKSQSEFVEFIGQDSV